MVTEACRRLGSIVQALRRGLVRVDGRARHMMAALHGVQARRGKPRMDLATLVRQQQLIRSRTEQRMRE